MTDPAPQDTARPDSPSDIITYRTTYGAEVIISRQALAGYGEAFIDDLVSESGKRRVVIADEHVLADAQRRMGGDTPMVDLYYGYLANRDDFAAVLSQRDLAPETAQPRQVFLDSLDKGVEASIRESISGNAPSVMTQPGSDSAIIMVPSMSGMVGFGRRLAAGLANIDPRYLGNLPGTDLEWAQFALRHEVGHIQNGDADRRFTNRIEDMSRPWEFGRLPTLPATQARATLEGEIEADRLAVAFTEAAGGAGPDVAATAENMRTISGFMVPSDIIDYAYSPEALNDHNTGPSLADDRAGRPDDHADGLQYATAYGNTLIQGAIGAVDGDDALRGRREININNHNSEMFRPPESLNRAEYNAAMDGEAPLRLVSLGRQLSRTDPQKIYAATNALYEAGAFDSMPEARQNASDFLQAVRASAPGLIDPALVERYRAAVAEPDVAATIGRLQAYRQDEPEMSQRDVHRDSPVPAAPAAP